jgi:hypothetical protein
MPFMKIINPRTGATITGEAGDNIGRGGRKLIYFKDESAHYERPEKIEAALADNTNCQIDISSVNGLGNVFHRRREAGSEYHPGQPLARNRVNVFVMDWREHPAKDQRWYDERKAKAESDGLLHVFAQEVDRDYSASVEGVIIPAAWVTSAIDAHEKLGFDDSGAWGAALDVADEGGDLHALAARKGPVLREVEDWGEGDVGKATRRAIGMLTGREVDVQYDSVGVGAGVKSEANRLEEEQTDAQGPLFRSLVSRREGARSRRSRDSRRPGKSAQQGLLREPQGAGVVGAAPSLRTDSQGGERRRAPRSGDADQPAVIAAEPAEAAQGAEPGDARTDWRIEDDRQQDAGGDALAEHGRCRGHGLLAIAASEQLQLGQRVANLQRAQR